MRLHRALLAMVGLCVFGSSAQAACTSPPGNEAQMIYSTTYHAMEFCNGTQWVNMTGGNNIYSPGGSTNPTFAASNGYFVLTAGSFTGNLGGLSGANASCLSDLTNNNWNGKSAAQGFGILTAGHVFAYLCDGNTCNSPTANKNYYFATSGDPTAGGSYFTADSGSSLGYSSSGGPGTSDGVQYSALSTFNVPATYWTNRGLSYNTTSVTTPSQGGGSSNYNCQGFTSVSASQLAIVGISTASNGARFNNSANPSCNANARLICMVNP